MFIPGLPNPGVPDPYAPQQQMPGQDPMGGFQPGGAPANVMQILSPPPPLAVQQAPQDLPTAQPQLPQQALPNPSTFQEPRKRHSLLDTIGQISDVLAKVGGAEALYQPTLDARDDRARMIDTAAMEKQLQQQQLTAGQESLANAARARVGMAMKGLQAIKARGGDVNAAWPILAQRAGVDPQDIASLGQVFQSDPNQVDGIAEMFDAKKEFGLQPFYAQGKDGKLHAYQIAKDGSIQPVVLPEGEAPIDPLKFVDTGGAQVGYGTRSGRPQRILPKSERPGYRGGQPINERPGFKDGRPIAPAPGKGEKAADPAAARSGLALLDSIQGGFDNLHKLGALPGEGGGVVGQVSGMIGRTGIGQAVGATMGLQPAQERELLAKNLANLQSDLIKSLPASAMRTKFEQEIQRKRLPDPMTMSYDTANRAIKEIRQTYLDVLNDANASPKPAPRAAATPRRGPARVTPRGKPGVKPTVSNW